MLQLIKKQGNKWHIIIHGQACMFTPIALYIGNGLFPEKPDANCGLRWRVKRKWVSYKQIKKVIIQK